MITKKEPKNSKSAKGGSLPVRQAGASGGKPSVSKAPKADKEVAAHSAPAAKPGRYIFSVGRRKTAVAKVKIWSEGTGEIMTNGKAFEVYFPTLILQKRVTDPAELLGLRKSLNITAILSGGGKESQAGAMALAIARGLVMIDATRKTTLKKQGMMTRDSRKKERKKPGLKRARRAPQWQKR